MAQASGAQRVVAEGGLSCSYYLAVGLQDKPGRDWGELSRNAFQTVQRRVFKNPYRDGRRFAETLWVDETTADFKERPPQPDWSVLSGNVR